MHNQSVPRKDNRSAASLLAIVYVTVVAYAVLYAPQPILPVLRDAFGISEARASLFITFALAPLSVAPLAYGCLLESCSARRLMSWALFLLTASELAFYLAGSFPVLLAIRALQGCLVPALLTALMTYVAAACADDVARLKWAMSVYIAATVFGGFFGRFVSGLVSSLWGWRAVFLVLAVMLGLGLVLLRTLTAEGAVQARSARPSLRDIRDVLGRPGFLRVFLVVFSIFFVFASLMTFLPFRLKELSSTISDFRISLIYTGNLIGILGALAAPRLCRSFGEIRVMRVGLAVYIVSLVPFVQSSPLGAFVSMFLFCIAMFAVHATAPGYLNARAGDRKGVVNGLYLAFYYSGGALGSSLPGLVYRQFGWTAYIGLLMGLLGAALVLTTGLGREGARPAAQAAGASGPGKPA